MPLTDEERALAKQLLAECRHKFTDDERQKGGLANKGVSTPAKKKAAKARGAELKARGHYERLARLGLEKGWQSAGGKIGGKIGGRKGGASRSEAKAAAARANLKKANEAKRKAQPPTPFVPDI